ncbi:uncharacterized protein LOC114830551 [Esox lucius]|uniref:uncharacterized protein LOC114830551 n=1 Tax=Esox lucius TaxID=8010 RepID=UPI00147731C1|nr:uncharacterized protein LOC114830551 [Esox lucius]
MCINTILTPLKNEEYCLDGTSITLSYKYSRTATGSDYFYWYRQDTAQRPEFLLYILGSGYTPDSMNNRISVNLNEDKNRMDLTIFSAESVSFTANLPAMFFICSIIVFSGIGGSYEQTIEPNQLQVYAYVGSKVQYSCKYSSEDRLLWYKQSPGSAPQYLLVIQLFTGDVAEDGFLDPRFSAKLNKEKTRVDLEISSAEVTDSALYYCALQPTVTGNTEMLYKNIYT